MALSNDLAAAAQAADTLERNLAVVTADLASSRTELATAKTDLTTANAEIVRLKALLEPPPPPPPPPPPTVIYPGQPPVGKLYWGATIQGNNYNSPRLLAHEAASGAKVGLHRSFFQWTHRTGYMIDQAKGDLAAGRLPWVSIKTPGWAAMAAGTYNSDIDAMLKALEALSGPVWLSVHHEPEGGGEGGNVPDDPAGPVGWLNMQRVVRARMTALGTKKIALVPVLMSYTWNTASGRNPEQWWTPGVFDLLGIDHYVWSETTLVTPVWQKVRDFAKAKGVDIAVGEWGVSLGSGSAGAGNLVRAWYDHTANSHADSKGARIVAQAVFDYDIGPGSDNWTLTGEQLKAFQERLKDGRTFRI